MIRNEPPVSESTLRELWSGPKGGPKGWLSCDDLGRPDESCIFRRSWSRTFSLMSCTCPLVRSTFSAVMPATACTISARQRRIHLFRSANPVSKKSAARSAGLSLRVTRFDRPIRQVKYAFSATAAAFEAAVAWARRICISPVRPPAWWEVIY